MNTIRDEEGMVQMLDLELVCPTDIHEQSYYEMISEWEKNGEGVSPGALRSRGTGYKEWLLSIDSYRNKETCPPSHVPTDTYFLTDIDGRILGAISIRHQLTDRLLKVGGHIGYGVRPSERRKGYAKAMLRMALEKCKTLNLDRVLITCDQTNTASARTIIACGGVLENELLDANGNAVLRFWVDIL